MPGAPVMKDYDSFTDGTQQGSFDSIPAAGEDLNGAPILGLTDSHIEASVEPQTEESMRMAIEMWRSDVSMSYDLEEGCSSSSSSSSASEHIGTRASTKRPRSTVSSNDEVHLEEQARRMQANPYMQRTRAQSMSSVTSTANSFAWAPTETPVPVRPPSRAAIG
jgi:hypothetical protein